VLRSRQIQTILGLVLGLLLLGGCALPQVSAEERLFLTVSLDFLGEASLPPATEFEGTAVRGLSALAYDRQRDRLYALSDDRGNQAPARFYTLDLEIGGEPGAIALQNVTVESVTTLTTEAGEPYTTGSIDPEGIALTPRQTVFVSSEGDASQDIAPFIDEFDLTTGQWKSRLPIPQRFIPQTVDDVRQGVRNNKGFEGLALGGSGAIANSREPFRLFAITESALEQDQADVGDPTQPIRSRFLHYLVGEDQPTLIAEHLYLVDPPQEGVLDTGAVDLVELDQAGHFLALERSFGLTGFTVKLYQLATGGATDISTVTSLSPELGSLQPIRKQLVLDLNTLDIAIDNLEGITLGPRLPDGSQSLLLVSDDNFQDVQKTQLLLFRLKVAT
jgi:hypothetical protein